MAHNPMAGLDWRRWFDRMLPQTLQIALWLLYIDGLFALLDYLDGTRGIFGWSRLLGGVGGIVAPLAVIAHPLAGVLIANGRRLGWHLGIFAAFSPFVLRVLIALRTSGLGVSWIVTQDDTIGFVFEAALVVLLFHPMSRGHATRWLR
ncbi:MAG: hypothetical protein RLZZ305_1528 [Actinomycetota bacterium]|jgi:hypothetical protein